MAQSVSRNAFQGKLHMKAGDTVVVLSGRDKGKTGKVTRAYPKTGKLLVEGINIATKHTKGTPTPAQPNPVGEIKKIEVPILACKVALLNDKGEATRIRIETGADGKKQRIAVKGGKPIPEPAK
jgi:large subunit ribosomal protein L24